MDKLSNRDIMRIHAHRIGHEDFGVLSLHNDADWALRSPHWATYTDGRTYYASMRPGSLTSVKQEAPWGNRPVFYVTGHGEFDKAKAYLSSGQKKILDAQGISRILQRDREFTALRSWYYSGGSCWCDRFGSPGRRCTGRGSPRRW
ncbi:hypothetical protein OG689_41070 [Kitasatospora sp. NBC_00240]|uniref:hypothetical protein n=1 Tax=Kitasatospora sp. NBC_00240 TaxID=2903567 RepID=UPI00225287BF|nr:hypothetical protein [Kitasatospora sp. NBC_00240]MCX5215554.1 hypothetical protein [Kitasatospora sp. NBC_00240]